MYIKTSKTLLHVSIILSYIISSFLAKITFNCNCSKEQSKLPENDRMIETCRSVLSALI